MTYVGSWAIDDNLVFVINTQVFATGVATDADSAPAYRVYEDETGTPILTGTMALLDSANTAGFYSEQITLSAANGFEKGKCYSIYIAATVSSVAGATNRTFQIQAAVDTKSWAGTAATLTGGLPDVNTKTIAAGIIAAATFAANALDAVWSTAARVLTAGTNIVLAKGVGVTGFTDLSQADVRTAVGLAAANLDTQLGAIPTANTNADALLDRANAVDTGVTVRNALRGFTASLLGKLSGAATTNVLIRNIGDTKNVVNATVDASGNRSAVTLDLT
jgi:hypothetical protein